MKHWKIRIPEEVKIDARKRGIPEAEIEMMIGLFLSLETVENPKSHESVSAIHTTNDEWYRQRPYDGSKPRNIFTISRYRLAQADQLKGTLRMKAILPKDDHTYDIVRDMWLAEE